MTSGADHYFSARPKAKPRPGQVRLPLAGVERDLVLRTDAGTFSAAAVDPGTRFLLDDGARPDPGPATLVDVGCGYGPIAVALALWAPEATVWAIDVNERALGLTRANADELGVGDRVRTAPPEGVPDGLVADGIWSNPPIRVGKAALHGLLATWLARLRPDGEAHLVVAKNLGADSLARWLTDQGHPVSRRGSRRGYRLLDVGAAAGPSAPTTP
ncbi:MAG: class I SAM-dependent methyltransferase [Iamia sp.]